MSKLEESIGFYRKMSDLQEKLRRSEEERLQLEEKFASLMRACRDEEEVRLNNLRERFEAFLEEEKHRKERNDRILQTLDRIESRAAILTAKSERLKLLRKHYEVYMLRMYPGWKYINRLADTPLPAQTLHSKLDLGSDHNLPYIGVTSTASSFSADIVNGPQVPSYHHNYPVNHVVNQTLSSSSQPYPAANQPLPSSNQVYPTVNQPLSSSHSYSSANQPLRFASHPHPSVNQATSVIPPYSSVSQPYPVPGVMPIPRQTYPPVHPYPLSSVTPTIQQRPTVPAGLADQPCVIPGVSPEVAVTTISATQPLSRVTTTHETAPSTKIVDMKPMTNITDAQVEPTIDTNYSVQKQQGQLISEQDDSSQEINQAKKMDQIDGYLGRAAEMLKMSGININDDKSNFQNLTGVMPQISKDNKHLGNSVDIELEQNTSGDILNVTLSDDGILQDEPSKTLVSPTQKSDENKHIHFTDDTNLEMLEEVSHEVNPQQDGGGDIAATSVSSDKQEENMKDGRLHGGGDSFMPENDHMKENIPRTDEEGNILKGKSSDSLVNDVKLKEIENNKMPEHVTVTEVVGSQNETSGNLGQYTEGEQQYAEQQQWDENAGQYYQQDGQYYQYGDEMYQQEYAAGEYGQQYAEGQYDQQYAQGDYDQQYEEYNQQYTEEEYQEYERQLLQQQQNSGGDNGKFTNQTVEAEQKQENYEQTQQYKQQQSQDDLPTQHGQQQQQGSQDDQLTQHEKRQQQSQDDQPTQHEKRQQQSQDDQPTQQHEDQRHESNAEKQIPEVVPAEFQTNQFGESNQLRDVELKLTESKRQETGEVQQAVVDPAVDSESSREDVKPDAQPQQIEFSSDVTDPSLSAEKMDEYRQLLGVPAAGEPETSDTDELEAQLAALVDTKHDGDKQKGQPQQTVASEQKTSVPAVKPTAEDTTTSSNSKPEALADVKQELKPVVIQKTSRPVSKKLPDLNKVLESDSESLQLDATVSNADSDDFDFSSEK